jgi:hypothetical protein
MIDCFWLMAFVKTFQTIVINIHDKINIATLTIKYVQLQHSKLTAYKCSSEWIYQHGN